MSTNPIETPFKPKYPFFNADYVFNFPSGAILLPGDFCYVSPLEGNHLIDISESYKINLQAIFNLTELMLKFPQV